MSRPLRIEFPGAVYHITSRVHRREPIYRDDDDRLAQLDVIAHAMERFDAQVLAYCQMGNHQGSGSGLEYCVNLPKTLAMSRRWRIEFPDAVYQVVTFRGDRRGATYQDHADCATELEITRAGRWTASISPHSGSGLASLLLGAATRCGPASLAPIPCSGHNTHVIVHT
jgi:hypothetical protein